MTFQLPGQQPELGALDAKVRVNFDMARGFSTYGIGAQQAGIALAPFAAAAGLLIKNATRANLQLGETFTQIAALVGESAENLDMLRQKVLDLAGETGRAPQELAQALYFVESAGLRGADAAAVLEASAKAAAVGLGETKVVADALTSAMNAYAASGLSAERATDILVATVREGKVAPSELAGSLGRVIPIASQLGVGFDEVGAAMAAMTRIGLNAEESATALRQILVTILNPTNEARDALADYGLNVEDLQQKLKDPAGLLDVLLLLQDRFQGSSEATAKVFGNIRALTGQYALVGENLEQTRGIWERMIGTVGDLGEAFETTSEDPMFKMRQMLGELQAATVDFGEVFVPILLNIVEFATKAFEVFSTLPEPVQRVLQTLTALTALSTPFLLFGAGMLRFAGSLKSVQAQALKSTIALAEMGDTAAIAASQSIAAGTSMNAAFRGAGMKTATTRMTGAAKTMGFVIGAELVGSMVQSIRAEEGTVGDAVVDTTANAIKGAGYGALLGSILPGAGTLIGAGIGAAAGGLFGFLRSDQSKNEATDAIAETLTEATEEAAEAVALDPASRRALYDNFATMGIQAGLGIEVGFESVTNAIASWREEFNEEIEALETRLRAFASNTPDLITEALTFERAVSPTQVIRSIDRQVDAFERMDAALRTLSEAGATTIADWFTSQDIQQVLLTAERFARDLTTDPQGILLIEASMRRIPEAFQAAFAELLQRDPLEQVIESAFGGLGRYAMEGDTTIRGFIDQLVAAGTDPNVIENLKLIGPVWAKAIEDSVFQAEVQLHPERFISTKQLEELISEVFTSADTAIAEQALLDYLNGMLGNVGLQFDTAAAFANFFPALSMEEVAGLLEGMSEQLGEDVSAWATQNLPKILSEVGTADPELIRAALKDSIQRRIDTVAPLLAKEAFDSSSLSENIPLAAVVIAGMAEAMENAKRKDRALGLSKWLTEDDKKHLGGLLADDLGGAAAEADVSQVFKDLTDNLMADPVAIQGWKDTGREHAIAYAGGFDAYLRSQYGAFGSFGRMTTPFMGSIPDPTGTGTTPGGGPTINIINPTTSNLGNDIDEAFAIAGLTPR